MFHQCQAVGGRLWSNLVMCYAATGGTGFVGRAMVRRLLNDGRRVLELARRPRASADVGAGTEAVAGGPRCPLAMTRGAVRRCHHPRAVHEP